MYKGDFKLGDTITRLIPTTDASGASVDPTALGSIRVYKDGGTTQRSSSAGITLTGTFDSLTGVQKLSIDTSDDTDAGFYAIGSDYEVVDESMVVDGQTVNAVVLSFSIENRASTRGAVRIPQNTDVYKAVQESTAHVRIYFAGAPFDNIDVATEELAAIKFYDVTPGDGDEVVFEAFPSGGGPQASCRLTAASNDYARINYTKGATLGWPNGVGGELADFDLPILPPGS